MPATTPRRLRIVAADDNPSIRENLRYLVNAEPDMECVGVARDGVQCVQACQELVPDVLVLDDEMPHGRGLQVLQWLATELPGIKVVMYTLNAEIREPARRLGAVGCVIKDMPYDTLVQMIRQAGSAIPRRQSSPGTRTG